MQKLLIAFLNGQNHKSKINPYPYSSFLAARVKLWDGIRGWKWGDSDGACACTKERCSIQKETPAYALTIKPEVFKRARHVVLMAEGKGKAEAIKRLLEGPIDPENFAAHLLLEARGKVEVLLDDAAASKLTISPS